ncbi:hypothetical protein BC830DRAFT_1110611 [Chytriomyces sp. MP71]|nr:hypothetical protein BC830DRAFT_1110611 [Chytriomyces sp. MP71]
MYLEAQVRLVLSPNCKIAPPLRVFHTIASLPHTYQPVPDNIADLISYDFAFERSATADAATLAKEAGDRSARFESLRGDRDARAKAEMNSKAPGFGLNLVPVQANPAPMRTDKHEVEGTFLEASDGDNTSAAVSALDLSVEDDAPSNIK